MQLEISNLKWIKRTSFLAGSTFPNKPQPCKSRTKRNKPYFIFLMQNVTYKDNHFHQMCKERDFLLYILIFSLWDRTEWKFKIFLPSVIHGASCFTSLPLFTCLL